MMLIVVSNNNLKVVPDPQTYHLSYTTTKVINHKLINQWRHRYVRKTSYRFILQSRENCFKKQTWAFWFSVESLTFQTKIFHFVQKQEERTKSVRGSVVSSGFGQVGPDPGLVHGVQHVLAVHRQRVRGRQHLLLAVLLQTGDGVLLGQPHFTDQLGHVVVQSLLGSFNLKKRTLERNLMGHILSVFH